MWKHANAFLGSIESRHKYERDFEMNAGKTFVNTNDGRAKS